MPDVLVGTLAGGGCCPRAFAAEQLAGVKTWYEPLAAVRAAEQGPQMHDPEDDVQPRRRRW